jgi:hypothetical protein
MIFTSHPLSPVVVARSFPSASSFVLPSPDPVLNNPSGYAPPSIIEVSPGDERVFAFFKGRGEEDIACIWHRDETMDAWTVGIWWGVKPGQGFVLAKWLSVERTVRTHDFTGTLYVFLLFSSGCIPRHQCGHHLWAPKPSLGSLHSSS